MSIVSSTYSVDAHTQSDGRVYVIEVHVDSAGKAYSHLYLADVGADYQAIMEARAAKIASQLADAEAEAIISGQ